MYSSAGAGFAGDLGQEAAQPVSVHVALIGGHFVVDAADVVSAL